MKTIRILIIVFFILISIGQRTTAAQQFVYMSGGRLYFPDGKELSLWGVNFQPCLSWEYNNRFKPAGVPLTSAAMKAQTDLGLDELQRLGVNLIRVHLTPADFTDANGNLVQTVFLDVLDYMVNEASKRNMYLYITLLNYMSWNPYLKPASPFKDPDFKQRCIVDTALVTKEKTYITALLNRTNPYTQQTYKSNSSIALFEILNEPNYYSYDTLKVKPAAYADFLSWVNADKSRTDDAANYLVYRPMVVKNYINQMYATIRSTGAAQPIVWNCNWNKFMIGNEDVFTAISQTNVEAVSFSIYPGNTNDMYSVYHDNSTADYTSLLQSAYNNYNNLGWAKSTNFASKAKVCYEFEEIYNQSSYFYPVLAQFFRSLGAQTATMWRYTFGAPAIYENAPHFLSLTCTPPKAASFAVAHQIFDSTPIFTPYNITSPNEQTGANFAISKQNNLSAFVSADKLLYTGTVTNWLNLPPVSNRVTSILGRGNSGLVKYNGSGIYTIDVTDTAMNITLEPNYTWNMPALTLQTNGVVTQLDYTTANSLSISLFNWGSGSYSLYSVNGTQRQKIADLTELSNLSLAPGNYVIVNNDTTANQLPKGESFHWSNGNLIVDENIYDVVRVYSFDGRELLNQSIINSNKIDLSSLPKANYIVNLIGKQSLSIKVIKN